MTHLPEAPFILVDGSSYLFRAYHGLPPLTNSKGMPTGAVYGVINMLHRLLKNYPTEHIAVVFDPKGKTFRDEIYPEYKTNREATPDDLVCQIKPLFEVIKALGLPLIIIDGYEADDVIGTLTQMIQEKGFHTLISTGDKDLAQLVNEHVTLINTMNNTVLDEAGVIEKFGVKPSQIIDYLALIGDSIDNIPGIPGVGSKTAVKWLTNYQTLDDIIANANLITGKVGEKFRANINTLALSKRLVTIKCDIKLPFNFSDLVKKPQDNQKLIELFNELEFKSWLAELNVAERIAKKKSYVTILSEVELQIWLDRITQQKFVAFDTETTSLDYMQAKLVGVSLALEPNKAAYVPLAHSYMGVPDQIGCDRGLALLRPMLENPDIKKIGHNLKYDISVLANHGVFMQGIAYDSMLESFILSSGSRNNLDSVALKYLGHTNITFEDVAGKGAKQKTFDKVDISSATDYAAEDADICLQIHEICYSKILKNPKLSSIFHDIEMPLVPILSTMERTGVLIDAQYLRELSQEFSEKIAFLEQKTYELSGREFNLSSPKQLQEILFDHLKLPIIEKTANGQPSTAESVLHELAREYELPSIILAHRSLSKLLSTYTDRLPERINPITGRVHTSYHQAGAWTGRFSSTDPNLQNIPIRTEEGRRIRRAFIASTGYRMLAADYSQIELRIMAHLSKDEGLLTAFSENRDIHQATAAEVFNVGLDDVTPLQRRNAKAINFGLIYGMSSYGLAKQLNIHRSEAQHYIDRYFERYPGVKQYMEKTRQSAHELGYVETLYGRQLHLVDINASNMQRQRASERMAINAPMQGTAADIIKRAMIKVAALIDQSGWDIKMIMQVHDELVFEVKTELIDVFVPKLEEAMANAGELAVPLTVGIGVGNNWDEAH